jgi:hypothetical protein
MSRPKRGEPPSGERALHQTQRSFRELGRRSRRPLRVQDRPLRLSGSAGGGPGTIRQISTTVGVVSATRPLRFTPVGQLSGLNGR